MAIATELEAKKFFAGLMLRHPGKHYANAQLVASMGRITDPVVIANIEKYWPIDNEVLQFKDELIAEFGEDEFLPTKTQVAHTLWAIAESPGVPVEDRIKALREYSALRGFIEKPGIASNIVIVNKVMAIRDHGEDDEWENRLKRQQNKLIEHVG